MSARFASSCSRNGISAVATEHELLRRHVHVLDLVGRDVADLAAAGTHEHALVEEVALLVDARVRLRDDVLVLVVGREVRDLVGDAALLDLAVRRLDEAEPVDAARSSTGSR